MDFRKAMLQKIKSSFVNSNNSNNLDLKVLTHEFETKIVLLKVSQGHYRIPENPKNWT